jgi:CHAT domain-containing protein
VILITPNAQKAAEYPIKAADLNRKVLEFRQVLQDPRLDPRPLAQEMYKILVGPVAKDLKDAKAETLMWSLDGVLRYVPIAALHDGEKYMIERYRNVVFTPASNARLKDQPSASWRGLGLGVTKAHEGFTALPAVAEELRGIIRDEAASEPGGVMPGTIKLDEAFTAESMMASLRQRFPLVHVASHFAFRPGNETDSFLLLGDGSRLTLAQIKSFPNVFGGVELLTLSACDTATGGAGANGKEVEGFGVLAQRQGAKAVVASLWPVADESTRLLMQEFYRLRESQSEMTKAEALRRAQLALLRGELKASGTREADRGLALGGKEKGKESGRGESASSAQVSYNHPYFWAPFILIGNWR